MLEVLAGVPMGPMPTTRTGRIGYDPGSWDRSIDAMTREMLQRTIETFREVGAGTVEVAMPDGVAALKVYVDVQAGEALRSHGRKGLYPGRKGEYGLDLQRSLGRAERLSSEGRPRRARAQRAELTAALLAVFRDVDFVLSPVLGTQPPRIESAADERLRVGNAFRTQVLQHTVLQNLSGAPAIAIPIGFDDDGLPVGAQLTAPRGRESDLVTTLPPSGTRSTRPTRVGRRFRTDLDGQERTVLP
jgi:Asp-tRNA(Asn)/Glu-tRNA(Gln) amidotransferase A subunit family amidase